MAGLRMGDQLLAIDGESVIAAGFDTAMEKLKTDDVEQEDEDEHFDEFVMDENYDGPVVLTSEDYEDDSISVSEVAGNAANVIGGTVYFGSMFTRETIQLDGKDAKTKQNGDCLRVCTAEASPSL